MPNEARRQTIRGQEAHRTLMDDMLNHEAEARAWARIGRVINGPDGRSQPIVDQVGGWGRIDRLGISRQYVLRHRVPRGWLIWHPDDVPRNARRQPGEEPIVVGQVRAGLMTERNMAIEIQRHNMDIAVRENWGRYPHCGQTTKGAGCVPRVWMAWCSANYLPT